MSRNAADLAHLVSLIAADLDYRGYKEAGVIRQAARALSAHRVPADDDCPTCGEPVLQSGRGRPRVYCDTKCRRLAEKRRRNGLVET